MKNDAAQELLSSELRCRQLLIRWNRERVVSDIITCIYAIVSFAAYEAPFKYF